MLIAAGLSIAGLATTEPWKMAHLAMLGTEALIFPALLLTWMSSQFTQRAAGYTLVLGGASLIGAVGAASASVMRMNQWADVTLLLLPISSFWSSLQMRIHPTPPLIAAQIVIAAAIFGLAWIRARGYRLQRRAFEADVGNAPPAIVS
jgi:hypothetical protein